MYNFVLPPPPCALRAFTIHQNWIYLFVFFGGNSLARFSFIPTNAGHIYYDFIQFAICFVRRCAVTFASSVKISFGHIMIAISINRFSIEIEYRTYRAKNNKYQTMAGLSYSHLQHVAEWIVFRFAAATKERKKKNEKVIKSPLIGRPTPVKSMSHLRFRSFGRSTNSFPWKIICDFVCVCELSSSKKLHRKTRTSCS